MASTPIAANEERGVRSCGGEKKQRHERKDIHNVLRPMNDLHRPAADWLMPRYPSMTPTAALGLAEAAGKRQGETATDGGGDGGPGEGEGEGEGETDGRDGRARRTGGGEGWRVGGARRTGGEADGRGPMGPVEEGSRSWSL